MAGTARVAPVTAVGVTAGYAENMVATVHAYDVVLLADRCGDRPVGDRACLVRFPAIYAAFPDDARAAAIKALPQHAPGARFLTTLFVGRESLASATTALWRDLAERGVHLVSEPSTSPPLECPHD
ncbi:MAG: hypothetical protein C0497_04020 [Gemmatimonas sp.]|nr:hypothetical protein [Gemmatimonas sp.]